MNNWPQQPRNIDEERQALAPYNFVPLPDAVVRISQDMLPDHNVYNDEQRLSGYINCELSTASPVYIRAGLTPESYEKADTKDNPDFFYKDNTDQPVIPGSSLRGLLRSLTEIITYSKVSSVASTKLVYRAVGDTTSHGDGYRDRMMQDDGNKHYTPRIRGGYMIYDKQTGDWFIQPAKEIDGITYAHWPYRNERAKKSDLEKLRPIPGCKNAYEIYVQVGRYEYQDVREGFIKVKYAPVLRWQTNPGPNFQKGAATLGESGYINSKRSEVVVFEPDSSAKRLPIADEVLDAYRVQVTADQKKIVGDGGILTEGQPVLYLLDEKGNMVFFGHCRMFRLPYLRTPEDFVPDMLRREEEIDLAEAIFGYTKSNDQLAGKARAYAGRVFVSDAKIAPNQSDIWLTNENHHVIVPKILGGPKLTTFQHYLVQTRPNKKQIGQTKDGRPKYTTQLSDYTTPSPNDTVIRGHKFYWHKGNASQKQIEDPNPKGDSKVHTRISPLKAGVTFRFRIDYENLTVVELGALLWLLDLAADEKYRLKIGMGKPLGMGAVKLESTVYRIDRQARYSQLFEGESWHEAVSSLEFLRAELMADFERFMLKTLNTPKSIKRLGDIERIQELLTMLSWPGPPPEKTRYLEIEHWENGKKHNEYRDRPVLPLPSEVWNPEGRKSVVQQSDTTIDEETGIIRTFNRGYGFIRRDNGKGDIFFHNSELQSSQSVRPGDRVRFTIGEGRKGPAAKNVYPIN